MPDAAAHPGWPPRPGTVPPLDPTDWTVRFLALRPGGLSALTHPVGDLDPVPCPACGALLSSAWAFDNAAVEEDGSVHDRFRCAAVLAGRRGFTYAVCPACRVEVHTMLGRREDVQDSVEIHANEKAEPHNVALSAPTYVLGHFALDAAGHHAYTRRPGDLGVLAAFGIWHHWYTPDPPTMILVPAGTPPYTPRPEGPQL